MRNYYVMRFLSMIFTLFLIVTITFFLMRAIPGGPFQREKPLPDEIVARLEAKYNLDAPLFEQYVDYALGVPMYFINRNDTYLDVSGCSFKDFMNGNLKDLPKEKPTLSDFDDHLSTIFPEVRLKTF